MIYILLYFIPFKKTLLLLEMRRSFASNETRRSNFPDDDKSITVKKSYGLKS